MIQFYTPDIEVTGIMPEEEAGHCLRVLRHKVNDMIDCTDGKGFRYKCRIVDANPRHAQLEIVSKEAVSSHWGCHITLAVSPTKNSDRMEWLLEKSVEIGIDRIVPVKCEHSERKKANIERWRKVMISAMKQSLKATLPEICEMIPLSELLTQDIVGQKFVGYCDDALQRLSMPCECRPSLDTTILIGPEGDFSAEEIDAALRCGFKAVTLGESRLRTETAALFALQTVHIVNQMHEGR